MDREEMCKRWNELSEEITNKQATFNVTRNDDRSVFRARDDLVISAHEQTCFDVFAQCQLKQRFG